MLEQKLLVGRFIDLTTPTPVTATHAAPAGFRPLTSPVLHLKESHLAPGPVQQSPTMQGFHPTSMQKAKIAAQQARQQVKSQVQRQRVSDTGVGSAPKVHRNFVWLEWIGGVVSEVQPGAMDVLTGPMSGCWIMCYKRGGVRCIGHVGTVMTAADPASVAAKAAWNNFASSGAGTSITGFDPFNASRNGPVPQQLPGESNRKTFALVTKDGRFFSVITYPQVAKPNRIRIAGIQLQPSSLPGSALI